MYMSKERTTVTKLMLFNDDGDDLIPGSEEERLVYELMGTFKRAKVNGSGSEVADIHAMRMAIAVINEWRITSMDKRDVCIYAGLPHQCGRPCNEG